MKLQFSQLKAGFSMRQHWVILDWASNDVFRGKTFKNFDDAEEFLSEFLGDTYETDRQEFEIVRKV